MPDWRKLRHEKAADSVFSEADENLESGYRLSHWSRGDKK